MGDMSILIPYTLSVIHLKKSSFIYSKWKKWDKRESVCDDADQDRNINVALHL